MKGYYTGNPLHIEALYCSHTHLHYTISYDSVRIFDFVYKHNHKDSQAEYRFPFHIPILRINHNLDGP